MDEIDAALDFRNVSIVANYIKVSIHFFLLTSRNERKMLNSLSFLFETTCSNLQRDL
jgi:hypothetical protein